MRPQETRIGNEPALPSSNGTRCIVNLGGLQFGFTITYHYLFPQLTMGLALLIVVLKAIGLRTGARTWMSPRSDRGNRAPDLRRLLSPAWRA